MPSINKTDAIANFKIRLIKKIKETAEVSQLNDKQQNELIEKLVNLQCLKKNSIFESKTRSQRNSLLKNVGNNAKRLAQSINLLNNQGDKRKPIIDVSTIEDCYHNSTELSQWIKNLNNLADDMDKLREPLHGRGREPDLVANARYALDGAQLCKLLDSYNIPISEGHSYDSRHTALDTKSKKLTTPDACQEPEFYPPLLDTSVSTAMTCAMLSMLESEIEGLDWSTTVALIASGKRYYEYIKNLEDNPTDIKEFIASLRN